MRSALTDAGSKAVVSIARGMTVIRSGASLISFDHGARDITRRRDDPIAARKRAATPVADPRMRRQTIGERGNEEDRHAMSSGKGAPGAAGTLRVYDVDAFGGDQVCKSACVLPNAQRIDGIVDHRQPFAAEGG